MTDTRVHILIFYLLLICSGPVLHIWPSSAGRYTDEPISKILCNISDGEVIHLDRWKLDVQKNPDAEPSEEGKDTLPLTVLNNYFSFGADAHIALEFHEARGNPPLVLILKK